MGLVSRDRPTGWNLESTRFHGPNVVSCAVVTGMSWTSIVGAYLLTYTLAHLPDIEEALAHLRGQDPILLVDINMDLYETQNPCSQLIANLLTEFGLVDLMYHYQKHIRVFYLKTWTQDLQSTMLRSR